ncbi:MAG: leucine-rich repeat domain-containing protein, partial [Clostridia bacterium]|nr:leucine-rich repeat domain-containing protein [Clostridia bacterium]
CHRIESLRIPGKISRYVDLRAYVTMAYLFGGEDPQTHREIVPDSLKTVAFYGTEVGSNAMYQCSSVQHLTLEAEISRIGEFAFAGCTALEFIGMPWREQAMEIGKDAFLDTVPYRNSAYWKNGILYLENHLIAVRSNPIGSVTVRDGTLAVADGAFAWQTGITSVYLPESVQIIGAGAFEGCTSLIDVTLPDTALRIGREAFVDTALYLDTSLWEEDVLYVGKHLIAAGLNLRGACTVKEGTLTIAEMAFSNTTQITSVTLPASLLHMERFAFLNCIGLTTVIFSEGIRQLPEHAFWNCGALENVVLPRSLTSIQSTAFSGCRALECIYYRGSSRAQWNAIGYKADEYTPDDLEVLLYSVNKPQDTEGRWHFGTDGAPVRW